jgi:hypothetical protein
MSKREPPEDLIIVSVEMVLICWDDRRIGREFKTEAEIKDVTPRSKAK